MLLQQSCQEMRVVAVCNWQTKGLIPQASEATLGYNLLFNDTADPAVADV